MNTKPSFDAAAKVDELLALMGPEFKVTKVQNIGQPGAAYGKISFLVEAPKVMGIGQLLLIVEEHVGKIFASASWPMDHNRSLISSSTFVTSEIAETLGGYPNSISISLDRPSASQAGDIQRKLLPKIIAFAPYVKSGIEGRMTAEQQSESIFKTLAAALGYSEGYAESRRRGSHLPEDISSKAGTGKKSAKFEIGYGDHVGVKLTGLTTKECQALIKLLNLNG